MIKLNRKIWFSTGIWLFLFILFFNLLNYFQPWEYALMGSVFEVFVIASMFYFTAKFLFPKFYKNNINYLWISLLVIIAFAGAFLLIDTFLPDYKPTDRERPPAIFHFFRFFTTLGFSYFVSTSLSLMERTTQMKENEKVLTGEKLQTELKLLKAQINPHFIFNALNNIYSLTYMKSKNAPESVLKLSEMLRYVFYDCSKDRVPLSAELKYIENFNAFQQMKSDYAQNITLQIDTESGNVEIAPMLFIPFIENAYKYSRIEENEEAYVNMSINSSSGKLYFRIENSVPLNAKSSPGSGMGIKNVKHRLAIIYPEKHELKIEEEENLYQVELSLEI